MLIKYNIMAVAGAAIAMLNTILIWRLFGITQSADIWLLTLAVTNILSMLVLVGVEQYLVFYTSAVNSDMQEAKSFATQSVFWAILSGFLFAFLCLLGDNLIIYWFASGFNQEGKLLSIYILMTLLPQVGVAPLVHVTRSTLNVHGKYGTSYALSLVIPTIMLCTLTVLLIFDVGTLKELGWSVSFSALLQFIICLTFMYRWCGTFTHSNTKNFKLFIRNSVSMRMGHSLHNFFVGLILNNALSHQAPGMIALFQYAKRFADGVTSVTVGPQINIYHARQALAWAKQDFSYFKNNIKVYLKITTPLFLFAAVTVYYLMPLLMEILSLSQMSGLFGILKSVFIILVVWQGVIAFETIFAGVVVTARKSIILWIVNGLYLLSFYLMMTSITPESPLWYMGVAAVLSQLMSLIFFSCGALLLIRNRFGTKPRIL